MVSGRYLDTQNLDSQRRVRARVRVRVFLLRLELGLRLVFVLGLVFGLGLGLGLVMTVQILTVQMLTAQIKTGNPARQVCCWTPPKETENSSLRAATNVVWRHCRYSVSLIYKCSECSEWLTYPPPPQPFYGPFSGTIRVSRCQKRTLWCKGRLTDADTPTIRLGATPSELTSAHLHHPPFLQAGCPSLDGWPLMWVSHPL